MQAIVLHDESPVSCIPKKVATKPGFDLVTLDIDPHKEAEYFRRLAEDEEKWKREIQIEYEYENRYATAGHVSPTGPVNRLCYWFFDVRKNRSTRLSK